MRSHDDLILCTSHFPQKRPVWTWLKTSFVGHHSFSSFAKNGDLGCSLRKIFHYSADFISWLFRGAKNLVTHIIYLALMHIS